MCCLGQASFVERKGRNHSNSEGFVDAAVVVVVDFAIIDVVVDVVAVVVGVVVVVAGVVVVVGVAAAAVVVVASAGVDTERGEMFGCFGSSFQQQTGLNCWV
jgi:uncharacterized membrane protein